MNRKILTALTLFVLSTAFAARAEQGGSGHYTPGSYTDFSGMPPTQPGWYFANYFLDYNNATFNGSQGIPRGGLIALDLTVNSQAVSPMVLYGFPFDFLGGTLSTGIAPSYEWLTVKAQGTLDLNGNVLSAQRQQSVNGIGDLQWIPVMAGWTNGDFSYGGMFNVYAPSGDYRQGQLASVGLGYWTFEPMLAFSWFSQKFGTEFTMFAAVDFNTENTAANYQSGDIFHVDATLAQHLPLAGGYVGAGASAFYLNQFTGDSGSGARLGNFEVMTYGVGPTVSYIHQIGKSTLIAGASWLPQLHSQNTTKGDYLWIRLTLQF